MPLLLMHGWPTPRDRTGVAIFPKDIVPAPREFAERFFNVQRWSEMPRGGHFAAMEEPELLVELREFLRPLRTRSQMTPRVQVLAFPSQLPNFH